MIWIELQHIVECGMRIRTTVPFEEQLAHLYPGFQITGVRGNCLIVCAERVSRQLWISSAEAPHGICDHREVSRR